MFTVKEKVYADETGKATHEATSESGARRELILDSGAVISDEQADKLGLRKLGKALDKAAVEVAKADNDPVARLAAIHKKAEAESAGETAKDGEASTPPASTPVEATASAESGAPVADAANAPNVEGPVAETPVPETAESVDPAPFARNKNRN